MVDSDGDGGELLLGHLSSWAAEHRQTEEVESRSRQWWLRRQAEETATWEAVLADLADRDDPVGLHLSNGRSISGVIGCLGHDFVAVSSRQRTSFVPTIAITALQPAPDVVAPAMGSRPPATLAMNFSAVLAWLAEEGSRISAWSQGATDPMGCRVRSVGEDVITLDLGSEPPRLVYVRVASLVEVSLLLSG